MPNTRGGRGAQNPGTESPVGERPSRAQMQRMVASKRMAQEQAKVVGLHDLTGGRVVLFPISVSYLIHHYVYTFLHGRIRNRLTR